MNTLLAPLRGLVLTLALLLTLPLAIGGLTACASSSPPAQKQDEKDTSAAKPFAAAKEDPALSEDDDMDGIPNYDDRCPTVPEDKDGVEDDDGCPDPLPK